MQIANKKKSFKLFFTILPLCCLCLIHMIITKANQETKPELNYPEQLDSSINQATVNLLNPCILYIF